MWRKHFKKFKNNWTDFKTVHYIRIGFSLHIFARSLSQKAKKKKKVAGILREPNMGWSSTTADGNMKERLLLGKKRFLVGVGYQALKKAPVSRGHLSNDLHFAKSHQLLVLILSSSNVSHRFITPSSKYFHVSWILVFLLHLPLFLNPLCLFLSLLHF